MIFVVLWFSLSSIINSIFHSILKYFCLPSLSSHVGTWKSSLLGATSTGTWPMRASSTCGTSSTCPRRSSPPPSAARPAQRPPDLVPRVRWSLFPHLKSFSNWNWLFCTFMMFQTHKLVCFPCNFCRISTSFPFNDIVNIVRTKKVDHRTHFKNHYYLKAMLCLEYSALTNFAPIWSVTYKWLYMKTKSVHFKDLAKSNVVFFRSWGRETGSSGPWWGRQRCLQAVCSSTYVHNTYCWHQRNLYLWPRRAALC